MSHAQQVLEDIKKREECGRFDGAHPPTEAGSEEPQTAR